MAVPFDFCVITASTPAQAQLYQSLVQRRKESRLYPADLKFCIYADPPKGRVGSGGGTLVALSRLFQDEVGASAIGPGGVDEAAVRDFFGKNRVLVLHAGGESRRLPCYVPEGKLFGPLSMESDAEDPPVVLDLVLALYFKYPWVHGEVILASGDVIVDFDVAALSDPERSYNRGAICGFGKAASLEQGSRHGVFAFGDAGADAAQAVTLPVKTFLQKASVEVLQKECLIPGTTDKCALDTGIFTLSTDWCVALFRFAGQLWEGASVMHAVEESKFNFDFYDEVVRASLPGQEQAEYLKSMSKSKLPGSVLEALHGCMAGLELRGASMPEVRFLHFGTLREFPQASMEANEHALTPFYTASAAAGSAAKLIDVDDSVVRVNCSSESVAMLRPPKGLEEKPRGGCSFCCGTSLPGLWGSSDQVTPAWVEMCSNSSVALSKTGFHLIVGLYGVHLRSELPPGICLDGRLIPSLAPSQIVAVYSADDTFKAMKSSADVVFCGSSFPDWLAKRGLTAADVWEEKADAESAVDLWTAKLFRRYEAAEDLEGYWTVASFSKDLFLKAKRFSLRDLNLHDSAADRDTRRAEIRKGENALKAVK